MLRALTLLVLTVLCVANAAEDLIYQHVGNGRFRRSSVATDQADPAGQANSALLAMPKRISTKQIDPLVDDLVTRIAAGYASTTPPALSTWLDAHPDIRKAFWLAIDPVFDDPTAAIAVMDELVRHDSERAEKFYHLAIAMAVVHDTPDAVLSSRLAMIWAVEATQFPSMPDKLEIFDYLTSPAAIKRMPYPPDKLVWPLLVHVVDLDLPDSERAWVVGKFLNGKSDLSQTYSMVPYDYGKLNQQPKLGNSPYLLGNVLAKGGVCVDQAHFSSRVMKTFGIPAIKVSGESRYGGMGHAWTGFLQANRKGASFAFTGRYNFDYYYTGDVFDPHTRRSVLDREMAMELDGALHNYASYVDAGALVRIATSIASSDPSTSLRLTEAALDLNPFRADAWRLLAKHLSTGTLDLKAGTKWLNTMAKKCYAHPDLTLEVLNTTLDTMPANDLKKRGKLYASIYTLYKERPDLQIALRRRQCAELYAANEADMATSLAVHTLLANAKEGSLVLPLVEVVVADCQKRPADQRNKVHAVLVGMNKDFPKSRGDEVSQAWLALQEQLALLKGAAP
ncbi:MAG: hypothetical protein PF961_07475 [Planctomycetota bacterium]|jgi:hypothetical protein|nr:hypothetical protein [Planctomycetota bacterium]